MIKIEFSIDELNALIGLMDAGVKTLGLSSATNAAILLKKIQDAAQENKPIQDVEEIKDAA